MSSRRNFLLGCVGLGGVQLFYRAALGHDLWTHLGGRRRVCDQAGVPAADYQYRPRTPSVIVRTLPAISIAGGRDVEATLELIRLNAVGLAEGRAQADSLQVPLRRGLAGGPLGSEVKQAVDALREPQGKQLQLATRSLDIGHCRVYDFSLDVRPSGDWATSFKCEYVSASDGAVRQTPDRVVQRNAFHVSVRLLRSRDVTRSAEFLQQPRENIVNSTQVLAELKLPEFWVQRDVPRSVLQQGWRAEVQRHYDEINQAEIEFYYSL